MTTTFPPVETAREFQAIARDDARLLAATEALSASLGLTGAPVRFGAGSLPVYAIAGAGEALVLKLYPPPYLEERDVEAHVLGTVAGRLPIPTPAVRAVGRADGWGYVLMSRLPGEEMTRAWPRISQRDRAALAATLGEALARLHATAQVPKLGARADWDAFHDEQRRSAEARQRARGLSERWVWQIERFLAETPLSPARTDALLHTEVMREHLLVAWQGDRFRYTGLVDFEPARLGPPEYELASVGLFFTCGDRALLRALLLAYGYREDELHVAFSRRLLAYALLHKYSNLPWYLERVPPPAGARTLDELADAWFGV